MNVFPVMSQNKLIALKQCHPVSQICILFIVSTHVLFHSACMNVSQKLQSFSTEIKCHQQIWNLQIPSSHSFGREENSP